MGLVAKVRILVGSDFFYVLMELYKLTAAQLANEGLP